MGRRSDKISCDISPRALERWNPEVRGAASSDNNVISILDVIGQDWMGNGITSARVAGALRAIGNKDVTVEINSPGGDFFEGLAIYNMLREHPKNITVKVLGLAASAASIIAMSGDTIMVPRAGFLMIHNVWVVAMGDKNDFRDIAKFLEPFDEAAADVYAARSGLPIKDIAKMLDAETWIGGSDAVEQGFADSLLPSDEAVATAKNQATNPITAARRLEAALAKGERMPRSERRKLIKEISGTPSAADDGTPSAAVAVENDGAARLRLSLSRLTLATAS
jgi:ATP-dependent protease ClpP protease subunit